MSSLLARVFIGFVVASLIVAIARHARSLSPSGGLAAVVIGTVAVAAGFSWGVLLIVFFASTTALSRFRADDKMTRTADIVAKGGERDALQVLANGGVFAIAAALFALRPSPMWLSLGAGSLAASASDSWATEVGTLTRAAPRSVLTWQRVAAGTSGGVSLAGTLAAVAGAAMVAAVARALGWSWPVARAAFVGGFIGSTVDSVLGATLQARRWCDRCNCFTERRVHRCGSPARASGGIGWLDNDIINLVSSAAGGLVALTLAA